MSAQAGRSGALDRSRVPTRSRSRRSGSRLPARSRFAASQTWPFRCSHCWCWSSRSPRSPRSSGTSWPTARAGCRGISSRASRRDARRRPASGTPSPAASSSSSSRRCSRCRLASPRRFTSRSTAVEVMAARLIELNITNLAAVPSIIYGLLGLGLFVRMMGMGRSVLAGASTLALLVLPVVILSTREALRAVPEVAARGLVCAWRHQVADDLAPGAAGCGAGHSDRADPGALARHRRNGAAHHRSARSRS